MKPTSTVIPFAKLTPIMKRLAVAEDVLARLKTAQYVPTKAYYLNGTLKNADVQERVLKGKRCSCCALGAGICSLAGFENDVRTTDDGGLVIEQGNPLYSRLKALLGEQSMLMMEVAYEQTAELGLSKNELSWNECQDSLAFGKRYRNPKSRLRAIWTNVLTYGEFNPTASVV